MTARIQLPHGCSCSKLTVHPKNWNVENKKKEKKIDLSKDWYISYRFYDPTQSKPKQRIIKGMNEYKTLSSRQAATKTILEDEIHMLVNLGFNPFTGECSLPVPKKKSDSTEITSSTPLITALERAKEEIKVGPKVKMDLKSVLKYFKKSAELLCKDEIPVGQVKSRDIRLILNACEKVKEADNKVWSDNQFNHYRAHISMLFSLLSDDEIIDYNPVTKIKKADHVPAIRITLTPEQRTLIDQHLKPRDPEFRRYVHIFFHSGARTAELLRIQGKHVDLVKQTYKALIKKRKKMMWVDKTIKDIALPYWIEVMEGCAPNDYVFSHGLKPGPKPKDPHDVYDMWNKYVKQPEDKGGLGINVDMYPLKHLHTTEVRDILEKNTQMQDDEALKEIAEHNSHTSTAMVIKIYDTKNDTRTGKKVKGIRNAFA